MTAYLSNNYHKVRSVHLTEQYYREAVENVASYNSRLCLEKRQRLPFLDSQTGVAQNHGNLWIPYRYRCPGRRHGQIYSYPAQRWKKKCSLPLPDIPLPRVKSTEAEIIEPDVHVHIHPITTIENTIASVDSDSKDVDDSMGGVNAGTVTSGSVYHDEFYHEWENLSEPPDAGEIDHRNSDSSDFEETYIKKKSRRRDKKRPGTASGGVSSVTSARGRKKEKDVEMLVERDKPFACELCGARYKTRPGLTYHLSHSHNKPPPPDDESELPMPSPKVASAAASAATHNDATAKRAVATAASISAAAAAKATNGNGNGNGNPATKYCDFCLGDELENKKTGSREEMVSCADCGRCGHPSCLQFTANMIISVKKYPWQCIECKSCGICGTSDNDDQLLFCDDCDRGYHMYCLSPPLSEPPEGSWSCHLCIEEFYGGRKPEIVPAPLSDGGSS